MSKDKIKVTDASIEVTATSKEISFTYEGKEYQVILNWNTYNGYDMYFKDDTPDWAEDWDNENDEILAFLLDDLSQGIIEEEEKVSK